jgi:hypothetical protein
MSVGRYKRLKRESDGLLKIPTIRVSIPVPKDDDYSRGYIVRYFTQKANDINGIIYEISSKEYSKLKSSDLYITIAMDWRINGDPIDVKKSNSSSIRIASQTIPKISLYLPNLLQFYKK